MGRTEFLVRGARQTLLFPLLSRPACSCRPGGPGWLQSLAKANPLTHPSTQSEPSSPVT